MVTENKTEEIVGTKEVAARLKIEPRVLRAMLRKITGKATGERYEWKASDPFLKKLPELIKAEEVKKAEADAAKRAQAQQATKAEAEQTKKAEAQHGAKPQQGKDKSPTKKA